MELFTKAILNKALNMDTANKSIQMELFTRAILKETFAMDMAY